MLIDRESPNTLKKLLFFAHYGHGKYSCRKALSWHGTQQILLFRKSAEELIAKEFGECSIRQAVCAVPILQMVSRLEDSAKILVREEENEELYIVRALCSSMRENITCPNSIINRCFQLTGNNIQVYFFVSFGDMPEVLAETICKRYFNKEVSLMHMPNGCGWCVNVRTQKVIGVPFDPEALTEPLL